MKKSKYFLGSKKTKQKQNKTKQNKRQNKQKKKQPLKTKINEKQNFDAKFDDKQHKMLLFDFYFPCKLVNSEKQTSIECFHSCSRLILHKWFSIRVANLKHKKSV